MKNPKHPLSLILILFLSVISLILILNLAGKIYIQKQIQNFDSSSFTFSSPPEVKVRILQRKVSIKEAELAGKETDKIRVNHLLIKGIHIFPLLLKGNFVINTIIVDQPIIILSKSAGDISGKKPEKEARIGKLEIKNGKFMMSKADSTKNDTLVYTEADAIVSKININSNTQKLVFQNHSIDRIRVSAMNTKYYLSNGLYHATFDSLNFDSENPDFRTYNVRLKSNYPKYEIAHVTGVETDWYDISLDSFKLKEIRLSELLKDNLLIADKANLNGLKIHSFRDKRLPFPEKQNTKLPMQMINSLPLKIHTDTVQVKNSYIDYSEHRQNADKAGILKFYDLNVTISNLSNIDSLISEKTRMEASAKIMNESMLEAEFVFPNNIYPEKYQVTGTLEPLYLKAFNPMAISAASAKIESGRTKTVAFNFYYNNDRADGDLIFEYENLKIVLLNNNNSEKDIASFFANAVAIKKNNLQSTQSFNKGTVSFERDKKKSIFNYWWKSLQSGIKDSATP